MAAFARAASVLGFAASLGTVVVGLTYVWNKHPQVALRWSSCSFESGPQWVDCNQAWSQVFGLVGFTLWTPLLVGLAGVSLHKPMLARVWGSTPSFLQYGLFLVFQGFFGDFAYCGKLGVAVGAASCGAGALSLVAHCQGEAAKDLGTRSVSGLTGESGSVCDSDFEK
mmetsp:Transcript_104274/g.324199  ORF Transcript_104274/g.324199 Transcript_104274/m.324199 type:complete len:168 (+) Transcript_104274:104-607(+)